MRYAVLRWRLFRPILLAAALLQGCSDSRPAPTTASTNPATTPYDDLLTGGQTDWPNISNVRNAPATAPPSSPLLPTDVPSAKFSADVDEIVGRLILLARKLTNAGEHGAALRVSEAILLLDPKNDYALGVRPLLEDRWSLPYPRRYDHVGPWTQPSHMLP